MSRCPGDGRRGPALFLGGGAEAFLSGSRNAVSYRALYGNNRAINIAEIEPKEKSEETWEEEALRRIMKQIRLGDKSALEGEVKDCLKKFTENGSSLQKYRLFVMELIAEIMRFGNKNQLDMEELFRKESDIYQMVFPAGILRGALRMAHRRG